MAFSHYQSGAEPVAGVRERPRVFLKDADQPVSPVTDAASSETVIQTAPGFPVTIDDNDIAATARMRTTMICVPKSKLLTHAC
jgi:hypothetical protein